MFTSFLLVWALIPILPVLSPDAKEGLAMVTVPQPFCKKKNPLVIENIDKRLKKGLFVESL